MAQTNANLIWKIAELLRGPYQPNQYGDVILPFTILRRLDCILEPTKDDVLARDKVKSTPIVDVDHIGRRLAVWHRVGAYRLSTSVLPDRLGTVIELGGEG
jgi:type I restriction-modification system DNA methylase subunit